MSIGLGSPARTIAMRSFDKRIEFFLWDAICSGASGIIDQFGIWRLSIGLLVKHTPQLPHGPVHKLRIEEFVKQDDALLHLIQRISKDTELIRTPGNVCNVGIEKHSASRRENRTLYANDLAVCQSHVTRP